MPPQEVTGQVSVTFSGLRYNRSTGTFDTQATVINTSDSAIQGPIEFVVDSISIDTVTLSNAEGTSSDGHPFVTIALPDNALDPKEVGAVILRFTNPTRVRFTFTHRVVGSMASNNSAPVADAGRDQVSGVGATVVLNGGSSYDPNGDDLTYQWQLTEAPQDSLVNLSDASTARAVFSPDQPGEYSARLIVSDGKLDSEPVTVKVYVAPQGSAYGQLFPLTSYPAGVKLGATLQVTFTVRLVGSSGVKASQVRLQSVDATGTQVLGDVGLLHDDGTIPDLNAGDLVYSGEFTVVGDEVGPLFYRVVAEVPGLGEFVSEIHTLEVTPFIVGPQPSNLNLSVSLIDENDDVAAIANEALVYFSHSATALDIRAAAAEIDGEVAGYMPELGVYQILIQGDATSERLYSSIKRLSENPLVTHVEPNIIVRSASFPSDKELRSQWGIAKVRADEAWLASKPGSTTIAIVDDGIDNSHPDLTGKIVKGWNFLDNTFSSSYGKSAHGTHVAGIAAAVSNNGLGIAGISWDSKLLDIQVAKNMHGTYLHLATGIRLAAALGAKVINCSIVMPNTRVIPWFALDYRTLSDSVALAHEWGSLVVAGAGNDDSYAYNYPAAFSNAMAIGATDSADKRASFTHGASSYGSWVTMAAPGKDIISTIPGGSYDYLSGTSMAAPFVSGAAAVLWSTHPEWTPDQIRTRLEKTATPLPGQQLGAGRLDLFEAVFNGSFELAKDDGASLYDLSSVPQRTDEWGGSPTWSLGERRVSLVNQRAGLSPTHGKQFAVLYDAEDGSWDNILGLVLHKMDVPQGVKAIPMKFDWAFDRADEWGCFGIRVDMVSAQDLPLYPEQWVEDIDWEHGFLKNPSWSSAAGGWQPFEKTFPISQSGTYYLAMAPVDCGVQPLMLDHIELWDGQGDRVPGSPGAPSNIPPQIVSTPATTGIIGKKYTYDVDANDNDGDPLTYDLLYQAAGMTVDGATGIITWTPAIDDWGPAFVAVHVSDGKGGEDTQSFQIEVSCIVPDIVGLSKADAKTQLESAGLKVGQETEEHSTALAAGAVMGQSLQAGVSVDPETPVDLVISLGSP